MRGRAVRNEAPGSWRSDHVRRSPPDLRVPGHAGAGGMLSGAGGQPGADAAQGSARDGGRRGREKEEERKGKKEGERKMEREEGKGKGGEGLGSSDQHLRESGSRGQSPSRGHTYVPGGEREKFRPSGLTAWM